MIVQFQFLLQEMRFCNVLKVSLPHSHLAKIDQGQETGIARLVAFPISSEGQLALDVLILRIQPSPKVNQGSSLPITTGIKFMIITIQRDMGITLTVTITDIEATDLQVPARFHLELETGNVLKKDAITTTLQRT